MGLQEGVEQGGVDGVKLRHDCWDYCLRIGDVDALPAAQAMIEDGQKAVGVDRKVDAHNIRLLVDDVVEEA
jgi:hypothetical protein